MGGFFALAQSLPPPPAPEANHSVSAFSIVLVVLIVLGSVAMVSLSSRRFKRPAQKDADDVAAAPDDAGDGKEAVASRAAEARHDPDLLARLRRVTGVAPAERRRLGDRKAKAATDLADESIQERDPIPKALIGEPHGSADVGPADDEPRFPEPIPIRRRANRTDQSEGASAGGVGSWTAPASGSAMPGLTGEEIAQLESSAAERRARARGRAAPRPVALTAPAAEDRLTGELSGVVRELLFCANAGELLHGFALYSDPFLFRTMDDSGMDEDEFRATFRNQPAKPIKDWTRLAALRDLERHADNVVTATVVYAAPAGSSAPPPERFRFLKNPEADVWMIDDIGPVEDLS